MDDTSSFDSTIAEGGGAAPLQSVGNGTRERILDAATRLFLQYGYKRTTVDDIAVEAGVAKGSIYVHFSSKEDVFATFCRRVCRLVIDRMEAIAAVDGPVEQRLVDMMLDSGLYIWDFCHQAPHAPQLWAEVIAAASKYALEAYAEARKIAAGVIAEGQRQGVFRRDQSAEDAAWLFQLALQGFDPPFMLVDSREQIERQLPQLMDLLIRGLKVAPPQGTGECDV